MNLVTLIGRLAADPEVKHSGETAIAKYRLAVDRRYKKEGQPEADFISCVAFGKSGEFAEKYLSKGMKIAVEGRIQTGSYTKDDGTKVYTTDVIVEHHEFCEKKAESSGNSYSGDYGGGYNQQYSAPAPAANYNPSFKNEEYENIPIADDGDFPF